MGSITCVAIIFVSLYAIIFINIFAGKSNNENGFFNFVDSGWMNHTVIQGKNGNEIRNMALDIVSEINRFSEDGIMIAQVKDFDEYVSFDNKHVSEALNVTKYGDQPFIPFKTG